MKHWPWGHRALALSEDPSSVRGVTITYGALGLGTRAAAQARRTPPEHPLWALAEAQASRFEGDLAGALTTLETAIGKRGIAPLPLLMIGSELAVRQGKFAEARGWFEQLCPQMTKAEPAFDDFGFCKGVGYAYALHWLGEHKRSAKMLDAYLSYVAGRPRLGLLGFGIGDVEALALAGRRDEALARLREAVDAGWRWGRLGQGWGLADDPYLQTLRGDARFRAIAADVDADIARMRERAEAAEASGNWQPLLALAAHGEGRVGSSRDD